MRTRIDMHLVDDESLRFARGPRAIDVRVRAWRCRGRMPVVLVEADDADAAIRPWAPRIGTYVHNALLHGSGAYFYVERSGAFDDETWDLVEFRVHRHHYCSPCRRSITRAMVEAYVGASV